MKLFKQHRVWWAVLFTLTVVVSLVTSKNPDIVNVLFSMAGHFAFSFVASLIPFLAYWVIGNPLTTEEYMSTFTVAWLILAVANLSVM